jgi:hypothetical protein
MWFSGGQPGEALVINGVTYLPSRLTIYSCQPHRVCCYNCHAYVTTTTDRRVECEQYLLGFVFCLR